MKRKYESEIQRKIIKRYEEAGYMVIKIILANISGLPDLMLLKDGQVRFIEVKRPGEKPRPLQEYVIGQLRDAGFRVDVMTS